MDRHFSRTPAGQRSRNHHSASTGTTGPGLAGAALPNTHSHLVGLDDFDKLRVHALGKKGIVLEPRTDPFEIQVIELRVRIDDAMRVAHRHTRNLVLGAVDV